MLFITRNMAILLAGYLLTGCVQAGKNSSETIKLADTGAASMKTLSRAIIYFSRLPPADDKQLNDTISQACQCEPVLIRRYSSNAMIYEISLPQHIDFKDFEKSLLATGKSHGVQSVEQDALMHHQ